jgi:predicted NBD/HSP70 family sugar kinase
LYKYVIDEIQQGKPSLLPQLAGEDLSRLTVAMIVNAAEAGDEAALCALRRLGQHLGVGIASLVNALNPELVVFGGILSLAWKFLQPLIQEELNARTLRWNRDVTRVVLARHGSHACVMGGVATIYRNILAKPMLVGAQTDWAYSTLAI